MKSPEATTEPIPPESVPLARTLPEEPGPNEPRPAGPRVPAVPAVSLRALVWPGPLVGLRSITFGVVTGALAFASTCAGLFLRGPTRKRLERWTTQRTMRMGARLFGLEIVSVGSPPSTSERPWLVVANHRSGLDTLVVRQFLHGRSLAKSRVATWPVLGAIVRSHGTVFVDRSGAGSRVAAIRGIRTALAEGDNVIVFPEGMTAAGDDVHPFFRGAFAAARGYPVLCVGIAMPTGTEYIREEPMPMHLWKLLWRTRLRVGVAVGEVYQGPDDSAAAAVEARRRTTVLVSKARCALESREH